MSRMKENGKEQAWTASMFRIARKIRKEKEKKIETALFC